MGNIIGIDVGLNGGLSLLDKYGRLLACEPMPTIETLVGNKKRNQYDIQEVYNIIKRWSSDELIIKAGFERLRPIPKQSSQTGFSLGAGSMLFKTVFTILKTPFMEMEPRTWQKKIFGDNGIQYTSKTTKIASIQAAKQLSPGFNFKASDKCRVDHDGMTDSFLIGLFVSKNL